MTLCHRQAMARQRLSLAAKVTPHRVRYRWFHCSHVSHGRRWMTQYRAPLICGEGEPTTPRLCVCPTIAGCFSARLFMAGDVYVYRTAAKVTAMPPVDVPDAILTGEHWLTPPVRLELFRVVPHDVVWQVGQRVVQAMHRGAVFRPMDNVERVQCYLHAMDVLAAAGVLVPAWERAFVEKALTLLEHSAETNDEYDQDAG